MKLVHLVGFIIKKYECICRCLFDIVILVRGFEQDNTHIDVCSVVLVLWMVILLILSSGLWHREVW